MAPRESRVLGKLVALVLIAASAAAALLAMRQQRVEAAHDLARVQQAIAEHDQALWRLRLDIAARTRPRAVQEMAAGAGPMSPILRRPVPLAPGQPRDDRRIASMPTVPGEEAPR